MMAPPIPVVSVTEMMTILREEPKSTLLLRRLEIPAPAMVPKRSNIIPPSTACGILLRRALTLPTREKTIPVTAAIRKTEGLLTLVRDMAPVTSLYVVTGGAPITLATRQASPSPSMVRCSPGSLTKFFPVTLLTTYTSPMCSITGAIATGIMKRMGSQEILEGKISLGRANQSASATLVRSISLGKNMRAKIYPTTMPQKIGMSLIRPRV